MTGKGGMQELAPVAGEGGEQELAPVNGRAWSAAASSHVRGAGSRQAQASGTGGRRETSKNICGVGLEYLWAVR